MLKALVGPVSFKRRMGKGLEEREAKSHRAQQVLSSDVSQHCQQTAWMLSFAFHFFSQPLPNQTWIQQSNLPSQTAPGPEKRGSF